MLIPVENPPVVNVGQDRRREDQRDGTQQKDDTDLRDDRPGAKGLQWNLVGLRAVHLEG